MLTCTTLGPTPAKMECILNLRFTMRAVNAGQLGSIPRLSLQASLPLVSTRPERGSQLPTHHRGVSSRALKLTVW